jgi:hypothetical protein
MFYKSLLGFCINNDKGEIIGTHKGTIADKQLNIAF